MHWTPALEKLANDYVRQAVGTGENGPIPPVRSHPLASPPYVSDIGNNSVHLRARAALRL
jgi:hypothetical protein